MNQGNEGNCRRKVDRHLRVKQITNQRLNPFDGLIDSTKQPTSVLPLSLYLTSSGMSMLPSQNVLKLILKSPGFVPFGANLTHFGSNLNPWVWDSLSSYFEQGLIVPVIDLDTDLVKRVKGIVLRYGGKPGQDHLGQLYPESEIEYQASDCTCMY